MIVKNISFLWWVSKMYCLFIPAATKVLVFSTMGLVFPTSLQNANLEIIFFVLCMTDVYTSYSMEVQQRTERLQFEVSTLCCKLVAYTCLRCRFITNIVISTSLYCIEYWKVLATKLLISRGHFNQRYC